MGSRVSRSECACRPMVLSLSDEQSNLAHSLPECRHPCSESLMRGDPLAAGITGIEHTEVKHVNPCNQSKLGHCICCQDEAQPCSA